MDSATYRCLQQRNVTSIKKTGHSPLVLLLCAILCIFSAIGCMVDTLSENTPTPEKHTVVSAPHKLQQAVVHKTQQPVVHKTQKAIVSSKPRVQKTKVSHPTPTASTKTSTSSISSFNYPISSGNKALPEIALTFDDGPNPYYTPQILAILQQFGIGATFFDIGYLAKDYPALVQQEYRAGHIVGQHSWSHPDLTRLSASNVRYQLATASDAIQSATGRRPAFFRPPYGSINSTVMQQAKTMNLSTILWNDDPRDWSLPGVNIIIQRAVGQAHDGTIVTMQQLVQDNS